ncbi:hypothetical protein F4561_002113 [Lipingzhangella halophila]|uniref:YdhG-like domain-containing protein n=1 Tax=Lipingzhangella halophila TaxID=1783352 RepID=A0A7W7RFZ8_9ACTN|nr:DUF1801 domain-containing protein [Lipingzhangella halophila]MBB4931293.1 hypothetical protein [Lipingzhangella halophila]
MAKFAIVQAYIDSLPEYQHEIADNLLPLIETALPGAGAIWYGHPVWSLGPTPGKRPVCLIKAYPGHVTFGFWRGQEITDPSGCLSPGTRGMASVKLRTLDDLDAGLFTTWLQQARKVEEAGTNQ